MCWSVRTILRPLRTSTIKEVCAPLACRNSPSISSFGVRSIWGHFAPFISLVYSTVCQGPGSEPASAAPGGGRPSPGFALSSSRLATIHKQNSKPQDLRPALCLLRRPAEGKGCLQAEDGPLDSGCHCLGLSSSRRALPTQVACPLYERRGILLGIGSWRLADRYL